MTATFSTEDTQIVFNDERPDRVVVVSRYGEPVDAPIEDFILACKNVALEKRVAREHRRERLRQRREARQ